MRRMLRSFVVSLVGVVAIAGTTGIARADVSNSTGTNVQDGNNSASTRQGGRSASGDSVGGQVAGVVASGRTSVDARNSSSNSDITSGDADASNSANSFTGQNSSGEIAVGAADVTSSHGLNVQDGDNRSTVNQTVTATTGDGVGGQVIGAVTAGGGSSSIVAANTSADNSVDTGDADGSNDFAAFTGLNEIDDGPTAVTADVTGSCNFDFGNCDNIQDGSNRTSARQTATAATGDGVAGQVIGAVSAGATSIDASNRSAGVDVSTGDADSANAAASFTGLTTGAAITVSAADVDDTCADGTGSGCENVQDGSNRTTIGQTASSASGDGVGGEVIGVVTSAGGSASVVASNVSTDSDVTTGDADSSNALAAFVGLAEADDAGTVTVVADIAGSCGAGSDCHNVQDGDNRLTASQTAASATGDGVAGQVLGVVSAGAASVDAANRTDDSSVDTGDADAHNAAAEFVGLLTAPTVSIAPADVTGAISANLQDGSNRHTLSQTANATSGDGVAGQVSGVVTSAGGSASVVLANASSGIDSTSGDSVFDNQDAGFVGLSDVEGIVTI